MKTSVKALLVTLIAASPLLTNVAMARDYNESTTSFSIALPYGLSIGHTETSGNSGYNRVDYRNDPIYSPVVYQPAPVVITPNDWPARDYDRDLDRGYVVNRAYNQGLAYPTAQPYIAQQGAHHRHHRRIGNEELTQIYYQNHNIANHIAANTYRDNRRNEHRFNDDYRDR